jgi:hypothetical protein
MGTQNCTRADGHKGPCNGFPRLNCKGWRSAWNGSQTLSRAECRKIAKLLGLLQVHLASAIESSCLPVTDQAYLPEEAEFIKTDRRNWALAGRFINLLTHPRISGGVL